VTVKQNLNHNNPKNQYLVNYASNQPMDKYLTIPLPNDVPLELILVKPGHFIMGDEKRGAWTGETHEHLVHITQPFYIGKYPVTQAQWQAVMGNNPSGFHGAQRPVEKVSWTDIVDGNQDEDGAPAFLTLMNNHLAKEKPDVAATHEFRLPTEAEWEYAAKGGPRFDLETLRSKKAAELYPAYAGSDQLDSCGWFDYNGNDETMPVGLKHPNELGLFDMSGNIDEWCSDSPKSYDDSNLEAFKDPVGFKGTDRAVRGGAYWLSAGNCRSANRNHEHLSECDSSVGLRIVLSPTRESSG
jgi:sulfatase modifying factor 1